MNIVVGVIQFLYGISSFIAEGILYLLGLVIGTILYSLTVVGSLIGKIGLDSFVSNDVKEVGIFVLIIVALLVLAGVMLKFGPPVVLWVLFIFPLIVLFAKLVLTLVMFLMIVGILVSLVIILVQVMRSQLRQT